MGARKFELLSITAKYNPLSFLPDFRFPFSQLQSYWGLWPSTIYTPFICLCKKMTQIQDINPVIPCYWELHLPRAFTQSALVLHATCESLESGRFLGLISKIFYR